MLSKNIIFATLITAFVIFLYIKTVEADTSVLIHPDVSDEITLSDELLDKDLAIMVLGGIDYYVENCTSLTEEGVEYREKIISHHELNVALLPINPTYIKGAIAVTGFSCYEMYELILTIDESHSNLVIEPQIPTKYIDID
jgi:hypothetical protein